MATLQEAIDEIQAVVGALSGIRAAPDEPPEQLNQFPFAVAYAESGTYDTYTPEDMRGLHTIVVELHVARKDLPRDVAAAMAYAKSIPNAIFYGFLTAGTITSIDTLGQIDYEFGALDYGGQQTLGFRFRLVDVKTIDLLTA